MSDERLGADGNPTGGRTAAQQVADMVAAAKAQPTDPVGSELVAMTPDQKAAHLEFRDAAREARATQEAAQRAAVRYASAVKRLSEVMAPPSAPTE